MVSMGTRRPRRGSRLCRRWALQRRGDTPRLHQILRATKGDKLSDSDKLSGTIYPQRRDTRPGNRQMGSSSCAAGARAYRASGTPGHGAAASEARPMHTVGMPVSPRASVPQHVQTAYPVCQRTGSGAQCLYT